MLIPNVRTIEESVTMRSMSMTSSYPNPFIVDINSAGTMQTTQLLYKKTCPWCGKTILSPYQYQYNMICDECFRRYQLNYA